MGETRYVVVRDKKSCQLAAQRVGPLPVGSVNFEHAIGENIVRMMIVYHVTSINTK